MSQSDLCVFAGVDGCRAGWFVVRLTNLSSWTFDVYQSIEDVWATGPANQLVLIDIPIGLTNSGELGRSCDSIARRLLGRPRSSSVFTPPCRAATLERSHASASRVNYEHTNRRISAQAFGILPKIAEVDAWLNDDLARAQTTLEIHPEVLFWALSGGRPMRHRKSRTAGVEERLQVLQGHMPGARDLYQEVVRVFRRRQVAHDDILDALAAAVTGFIAKGDVARIPKESEADERGLPMQMVFSKSALNEHAFKR